MLSKTIGLVLGAALLAATAAPALACMFSTQAANQSQQQTAAAQPQQPSQTSTQ